MKIQTITETAAAPDRIFGSSAFTEVIFARQTAHQTARSTARRARAPRCKGGEVTLRVAAPGIAPSQQLALTGEGDALGWWHTERALRLDDAEYPVWSIRLPAGALTGPFEYKFIVIDRASGHLLAWEEGANRRFDYLLPDSGTALTVEVHPFVNPLRWRGAGVAVPVFSLRSEQSWGTGEFADLKLLVDWAAATGQRMIQILPVHDTTTDGSWRDSYPYNANSIFALHPQYIAPREVGRLKNRREQARFERLGRELNRLPTVDYERVHALKESFLRRIYAEQGRETLASEAYGAFRAKNGWWLEPYAVYCLLRDSTRTVDFAQWGALARCGADEVARFAGEHADEVGYYCFVQYHLDRQLRAVRDYAHTRGVILKGDIPIGISRTSADAWQHPELFRMDSAAGAPPDDFAVKGQNWGFPTYNWERLAEGEYAWWRARFEKMHDYFDAYRIDHILGFFRIWEIPREAVSALLGHFNPALPFDGEELAAYGFRFDPDSHTAPLSESEDVLFVEDPQRPGRYHPRIAAQTTACYEALPGDQKAAYNRLYDDFFYRRHDNLWRVGALRKLGSLVSATRMLVCGEDLGMIPSCVAEVMEQLQILSLEIERMPKQYGAAFGNPAAYPYRSVSSPATHDMSNIRLWWSEDAARSQRYYNEVLGQEGEAPAECTPELCELILRRQLEAASMWTVIPLQDWLALDAALRRKEPAEERINVPANPDQYWNYRMHLTLEQLLAAEAFNGRLRSLVASCGR